MFNLFRKKRETKSKQNPVVSSTVKNYFGSKINFQSKQTTALGKNGIMFQKGISLIPISMLDSRKNAFTAFKAIEISPINSKDVTGKGNMQIPKEDIPALIEELKMYYNSTN